MKDSTFFATVALVITLAVGSIVYFGRKQIAEDQAICKTKGKMYLATRNGVYCVDRATIEKIK